MRIATSSRARPWHEPTRIALTVLWVGVLTLWLYYQVLYLYGSPRPYLSTLTTASVLLHTSRPLWLACFFSAMAAGLGWYGFSHRLYGVRPARLETYRHRLDVLNAHFSFCTGCFIYLIAFRILPIMAMMTDGAERASPVLRQFHWGPDDTLQPVDPVMERWIWIAALAVVLLVAQGWGFIRRLGGRRRNLLFLTVALLVAGLIVPVASLHELLPSPVPREAFGINPTTPADRAILLGESESPDVGHSTFATYFETHDDQGTVVRFHDLHRNIVWGVGYEDHNAGLCEFCLLPAVAVFTLRGIPIQLTEAVATDSDPGRVVEVSRLGETAQVYVLPGPVLADTIPLDELSRRGLGTDWVVLKADVMLRATVIVDVLRSLREVGVRQVSLAVIPFGFLRTPANPLELAFDGASDAVQYEPTARPSRRERVIVVRKYIPPGEDPPRLWCPEVDEGEYHNHWDAFAPPPTGSVPNEVSVELRERMHFGRFLAILSYAWYGGAKTIHVDGG